MHTVTHTYVDQQTCTFQHNVIYCAMKILFQCYNMHFNCQLFTLFQVVQDGVVTWYESIIMLIFYVGYILVMRYEANLSNLVAIWCLFVL